MPRDLNEERRAAAGQRVRDDDARRMNRLIEFQDRARELDEEAQTGALDQLARKEQQLKEDRREALRLQEERWEQDRKKLAARPAMAPVFSMAPPPRANVELEYQRKRLDYERRREETVKHYDERLTGIRIDRSAMADKHAREGERRERWHAQKRDELAKDSERTFDARVEKEMQHAQRALTGEFTKSRGRSHSKGREM